MAAVQALWDASLARLAELGIDARTPQGERAAFTLLLWCTHVCFYWGYNLFIALVIHSGLIESRRIIKDKEPDRELFFRSLKHQLINHALQPLAVYYIVYPAFKYFGTTVTGPLPAWHTMLLQFALWFLAIETHFYFGHRILHTKRFYAIHKQHHEFRVTRAYAPEYAHPIEDLLVTSIPTLLPPMLSGAHLFTVMLFLVVRLAETIDVHSGYELPWSFFNLLDGPRRHDYHHSHNVGNFGTCFHLWDTLLGTDEAYLKSRAKKAE